MTKKMVIMLVIVGVLFGGIFGYKAFGNMMMKKYMSAGGIPPVTVSTIKASFDTWQPQLKSVGSLKAVTGVDISSEAEGVIKSINFSSDQNVKPGDILVQLDTDVDIAQLHALEAAAELAQSTYDRNIKLLKTAAISQSSMDAYAADLKMKKAQVAQQEALIRKKTTIAPFAGRAGVKLVDLGQYIRVGDKIVTLQSIGAVNAYFSLPQQNLSQLEKGQRVSVTSDVFPGKTFSGRITAINSKVDEQTRNILLVARIENPKNELLPGMYVSVEVHSGTAERNLTLPRTAVSFNPYGETVYIVEEKGKTKDGKPALFAKQTFVIVGPSRGDQVAIMKGIKEGDLVITSGQLKLKNGSPVLINNLVQPLNDAAPSPADQ